MEDKIGPAKLNGLLYISEFDFEFITIVAQTLRSKKFKASDKEISFDIDFSTFAPLIKKSKFDANSDILNLLNLQAHLKNESLTHGFHVFSDVRIYPEKQYAYISINNSAIPWLLNFEKDAKKIVIPKNSLKFKK